ncbi:Ig-like domain-containing protein [Neobacillus sp. NRS-1170]|uniref:Ig-like domain-containing protein n=1 Tax=Neobacillus sp. NRS-1170 TaxID=3233898 RepID=UPI003D2D8009
MAISQDVLIVKYHVGIYGQWITLANVANTDKNLSGWKIREYESLSKLGTTWTFPSSTVIKAKSLLIVKKTDGSGITGVPANIPVLQSSLGLLGRDREKIILLKPNNTQVDELIFNSSSTSKYSGNTPFQIVGFLNDNEAFERKSVTDTDKPEDWKKVGPPTSPIIAWGWAPLDSVPPTKVSNTPADGATNISVDNQVKVTFNEHILTGTALQSVTIKDANNIPVGSVQASVSGSELTIAHAPFENNKTYTVVVPAQTVKDAAGNGNSSPITWSFTTIADIAPPAYLPQLQYPANGATNVDVYAQVVQHFNESLFPGPALGSVMIKEDATNIPVGNVQASISLSNDRAMSIVHAPFEYNKTYKVNIPAQAVMDAAGNANASAIEWSFTTMAPPPQTAAPVADLLSFHNTVPEYAQVYGAYGAVVADPWGTTVRIYSSAAKDTVLGTLLTVTGSFWLSFNNSASLQTVYVTATTEADGKTESPVTPLPVSFSDTGLAVVSIEPAHGAMNVALDVPIKVTFNEPILAGSGIQDIYIHDHFNGSIIYVGGSVNGNELLIPHPTFMNSGYPFYDVFVPGNAVTDTSGKPLATPLIWTFSTEWIFW